MTSMRRPCSHALWQESRAEFEFTNRNDGILRNGDSLGGSTSSASPSGSAGIPAASALVQPCFDGRARVVRVAQRSARTRPLPSAQSWSTSSRQPQRPAKYPVSCVSFVNSPLFEDASEQRAVAFASRMRVACDGCGFPSLCPTDDIRSCAIPPEGRSRPMNRC